MSVALPSHQTVVRLAKRPTGLPVPGDDLVVSRDAAVPHPDALKPGQVLIENIYISLDPAIRGWMNASKNSYVPPIELGAVVRAASVGRVLYSSSSKFRPGQEVICGKAPGWAEYGVAEEQDLIPIQSRPGIPLSAWAGVLGGTGLTAYFGLLRVGRPVKGDVVLVSAASGAVGCVASQIAKHVVGCTVIGIAGGPEKCEFLTKNLGLDAAVDYKSPDFVANLLRVVGKRGVDVFFDNVGGRVLDVGLRCLAPHARVVLCGAVSSMNAPPEPVRNLMNLVVKSARMEGFILYSYQNEYTLAYDDISQWLLEGKLRVVEDVVHGVENAPRGFLKLFGRDGGNFGKLIVDVKSKHAPSAGASSNL